MRFTGYVVKMSKHGRISLPRKVRKPLAIEPNSEVSISFEGNRLILKKHVLRCLVTGKTENVIEVFPNVPLSPEGMEILLKVLNFFNS